MINQNTYSVPTNNPACMEEVVATKPLISELVNKIKDVCQENCGCANNIHDTLFGSNPSDPHPERPIACMENALCEILDIVNTTCKILYDTRIRL